MSGSRKSLVELKADQHDILNLACGVFSLLFNFEDIYVHVCSVAILYESFRDGYNSLSTSRDVFSRNYLSSFSDSTVCFCKINTPYNVGWVLRRLFSTAGGKGGINIAGGKGGISPAGVASVLRGMASVLRGMASVLRG